MREKRPTSFWVLIGAASFIFVLALSFGLPEFFRYQARANAENQIHINNLQIQQTQQLVQVEQQKAQIRTEEAKGIASAQGIINATLTDRYLQHEAIQAQVKMAGSPNHTQVYIPVGTNGIPMVHTVGANGSAVTEDRSK